MYKKNHGKQITCVFGSLYPDVTGGAEIFNYFFLKETVKWNRVILISATDPGFNGVQFYRLRTLKPIRLFYPFQLFFLLLRTSRESYIIYTSFMRASWLVYIPFTIFSFFTKVSYSFTIHGGGLAKWNFKFPYLLFFRRARKITGVSPRMCDEYKKRTGINIIYLPPLIPFFTTNYSKQFLRSKYKIQADKKVILFVGSLKPLKNPLLILNTFHIIGNEYIKEKKLLMVYAGDGILKEDILKYAEINNLTEYINLLGNIPFEDVHELYTLADYYLISSLFEGTPIALLEAMSNGLPILASDAPGINNIVKHNETALVYASDNTGELADRIKTLINDPVKGHRISNNAKKYFDEHFDYQKIVNEYMDLITK